MGHVVVFVRANGQMEVTIDKDAWKIIRQHAEVKNIKTWKDDDQSEHHRHRVEHNW
jgi:hypothetical protein